MSGGLDSEDVYTLSSPVGPCRAVGLSGCRAVGPCRALSGPVGLSGCRAVGLSGCRAVGLLVGECRGSVGFTKAPKALELAASLVSLGQAAIACT